MAGSGQLVPESAPSISQSDLSDLSASLKKAAEAELTAKDIPSIGLAIVNRNGLVLDVYVGFEDRARTRQVSGRTVFRMGSISKMFTAVTTMMAAEQGLLDIDIPASQYVPELGLISGGTEITLRQLLSHRAGLVREPPIGHYMDPTEPSLRATVASLADTDLVFEPGEWIKYSNAGFGAVGRALEAAYSEPFAKVVTSRLLDPLAMTASWTSRLDVPRDRLAYSEMWTAEGQRYSPPLFDFGMGPAGFLYATIPDLGKFASMLLGEGIAPGGRIVKAASLHDMWSPQTPGYASHWDEPCNGDCTRGSMEGGLAADLNRPFEGFTRVRHGGGVYGFSSELEILPEAGVGVIVVTTLDSMGSVSRHLAAAALRGFVAALRGETLPEIPLASDVLQRVREEVAEARAAVGVTTPSLGVYGNARYGIEVIEETRTELVILSESVDLIRLTRTGVDSFLFPRFSSHNGELLTLVRGSEGVVGVRIGAGRGLVLMRVEGAG